jgi:hypothetical protein
MYPTNDVTMRKAAEEATYQASRGNGSEVRQTQVSEQAGELINETEKLKEIVLRLEDRLSPLLRENQPENEPGLKADSLVAHAEFLRSRAWAIQDISGRLLSIMHRLEL